MRPNSDEIKEISNMVILAKLRIKEIELKSKFVELTKTEIYFIDGLKDLIKRSEAVLKMYEVLDATNE